MNILSIIVGGVVGFIAANMTEGAIKADDKKVLAKSVPTSENPDSEPKPEKVVQNVEPDENLDD